MCRQRGRFFITYFFTSLFILLLLLPVFPGDVSGASSDATTKSYYLWHLFTGSAVNVDKGAENVSAVATDEAGNIYVAAEGMKWDPGQETKADYGNPGRPLHGHSGNNPINKDILVIKFGPDGAFEWYTYYGGFEEDNVRGMAIVDDKLYVTGTSRDNWSGPNGKSAVQDHSRAILHPSHCSGAGYYYYEYSADIFVLTLNRYNGNYVWHTFIGESNWNEEVYGIAADKERIFLVGKADAEFFGCWPETEPDKNKEPMTNCDATKRINRKCRPTRQYQGSNDAWVLALDTSGKYVAHTFLGGSESNDWGEAIAIDKNGMVVVAGSSDRSWNYTHSWYNTPPRNAHSGGYDMFIARLARSDLEYHWHAFFGGRNNDWATAVLTEDHNGYYLAGYSKSGWEIKDRAPVDRHTNGINYDFAVVKMNNEGSYYWHTFRGGEGTEDVPHAIALSTDGDTLYVAGEANGPWVQGGDGAPIHDFTKKSETEYQTGVTDMAILALNADSGESRWHAFYGNLGHDRAYSIAVTRDEGEIIVGGTSNMAWTAYGTASKYTFPNNGTGLNPNFTLLKLGHRFKITASATAQQGTINPAGQVLVEAGHGRDFTIEANSGYAIDKLTVTKGGTEETITAAADQVSYTYSYTNVQADGSITATFKKKFYTIRTEAGTGGTITPHKLKGVQRSTDVSFTVSANDHYLINELKVTEGKTTKTIAAAAGKKSYTYEFENLQADGFIKATFRLKTFTITPGVEGGHGTISPATAQTVEYGKDTTFAFNPSEGYELDTVTLNGKELNDYVYNAYTFKKVDANASITATFRKTPADAIYVITASAGAGGTITPSGRRSVNRGGNRTFIVKADEGFAIKTITKVENGITTNLTGAGLKSRSYTFENVKKNGSITATFEGANRYQITSSVTGENGTISPAGNQTVNQGADLSFAISASQGYVVNTLTVVDNGVSRNITDAVGKESYTYSYKNVQTNVLVTVAFKKKTFTITASAGDNGTISPAGNQTVTYGADQSFAISANSGYVIDTLTVKRGNTTETITDAAGKASYTYPYTNVQANGSITVTFKNNTFTITASAGDNGTINPAGSQTVAKGANITFTFTPQQGYEVDTIKLGQDEPITTEETSYTFKNVTSNSSIHVTFRKKEGPYTITASAGDNGTINPAGSQTVARGANITFVATAADGYVINTLTVVENGVSRNIEGAAGQLQYSQPFTNVQDDGSITASFKVREGIYIIRPSVLGGNGTISPAKDQTVEQGGNITLTVTANENYEIDQLMVAENGSNRVVEDAEAKTGYSFSFNNVQADGWISVIFRPKTGALP